jgi:hypothetical protein
MPLSPETALRLTQAGEVPDRREIRIRFQSRTALLDAFALAQRESWIEDCQVALPRLELIIRMAGGFSIDPSQPTGPRRVRRDPASIAGQA